MSPVRPDKLIRQTATLEEIKEGRVSDIYFQRCLQILEAEGVRKRVRAELCAKSLPRRWPWAILTGVEECVEILRDLPINVRCMEEGTVFHPFQPVMEIEGDYTEFGIYETALLGYLCQASGVATKAARCRKLAKDRSLVMFGARRIHPTVVPMVERNAYVGGCDGVAAIKSGEVIGKEASGTTPHALMLILGDTVTAMKAFDEVIDPSVRRVALIDTFADEKFEAVRVAQALGDRLAAVRLDTPSSRRGDFIQILQEVRWELDLRGFQHIQIFVSGGLDEEAIADLYPHVNGYGVGTCISNAPVVDFSMDIVEIGGEPIAKRGKASGAKTVLRSSKTLEDEIVPLSAAVEHMAANPELVDLLPPLIEDGRVVRPSHTPKEIRERVLEQLQLLPDPNAGN
ncbi:MAG: nicotinate phosphoribosyltransferase [Nitrospinota bacterium]